MRRAVDLHAIAVAKRRPGGTNPPPDAQAAEREPGMARGHAGRLQRAGEARAGLEVDGGDLLAFRQRDDDGDTHHGWPAATGGGAGMGAERASRSRAARSTKRSTIVSMIWPNTGPITASSARLEKA